MNNHILIRFYKKNFNKKQHTNKGKYLYILNKYFINYAGSSFQIFLRLKKIIIFSLFCSRKI